VISGTSEVTTNSMAPLSVMLAAAQPPQAPNIWTYAVDPVTRTSQTSPPSIAMPGRTLSKAAFTRSSMVDPVAALMPEIIPRNPS